MIPPVVASERGRAQTGDVATHHRGCRITTWYPNHEQNGLESPARDGDSPVREMEWGLVAGTIRQG